MNYLIKYLFLYMEKYLDSIGLKYFWTKIKEYINDALSKKPDYSDLNGLSKIEYVEGISDDNGWITEKIAPENSLIISRMYLHPSLNMWYHCPSYETPNKGDKIITGGIKYGVAVVVGGTEAQTFPNCKYRVYYINIQ